MYGTQAIHLCEDVAAEFENDVKMYGTQANLLFLWLYLTFENDVKMYGTQAYLWRKSKSACLRMM